jgi:hypothetical protein
MEATMPRAGRYFKKSILLYVLLAFLPSWLSAGNAHDMHISVCELRWNEESGAFEVSIKVFIDDLERALNKDGAPGLFIGTPKELKEADNFIASYLQKHFRIDIDGTRLSPEFMGKEISEDFLAVWCYVQFPARVSPGKKCKISNDILLDMFDDQRNIMDIRMSKSHKDYTIFQPGQSTWSYTF